MVPTNAYPPRIHQHKDKSYTLDQNCYVLNTLQRYNPNSEFPERETPFPHDYTFNKDNQSVTDHDKHISEEQHKMPSLPLRRVYATLSCLQHTCRCSLCSLQTCKSLHLPWRNRLLCSYLAHRLSTTTPILCHQVLPRHHF
jgi:hypothetical protein